MSREEVSHIGKVVDVNPDFITVEIVSQSACSSCHAAGLCGVSEFKTKAVQVPAPVHDFYEVGQEVNVVLKASMGHKAVWLAYVIPLILLLAFILIPDAFGKSELQCALCGFFAVTAYYCLLYAFRGRLRDEYVFTIKKKQ